MTAIEAGPVGPVDGVVAALRGLRDALDVVVELDLDGLDVDAAVELIGGFEAEARRVDAVRADVVAAVGRNHLYGPHGHGSAKVMVRHLAQLSAAEANTRAAVAATMTDLGEVGDAYRGGHVGTPQVRRLARTHRNPRVREHMAACAAVFVEAAMDMEYPAFDGFVSDWERLVDEDGAADRAERDHQRRDFRLVQDYDTHWDLRGRHGCVDGAEIADIVNHFVDAERLADIDTAKALHGDHWRNHLPRSHAQLRADAFLTICKTAAGAIAGTKETVVETSIHIDHVTFEHHLAKLAGADPEPLDALRPGYLCRTGSGHALEPAQAVAKALTGHLRRVVYGADSVVTDLGTRRLFVGNARDAATVRELTCHWPGCWLPATRCQIDHLEPHRKGGKTNPGNGRPACGVHNRMKELGYHLHRDTDGTWHLHAPDGTEIPDHRQHPLHRRPLIE